MLALYPVDDPSSYGLVRRARSGEVLGFLEKPGTDEIDTDEISAGGAMWSALGARVDPPGRAVSIEREVFPRLVGRGLYGRRLEGYWMDIGTPERYLQASWDILEGAVETEHQGSGPYVGAGADVAEDATVTPRAVIRDGSLIGPGAAIADSVLLDGCRIGVRASVRGSILAPEVEIGDRATVADGAVIGRARGSSRGRAACGRAGSARRGGGRGGDDGVSDPLARIREVDRADSSTTSSRSDSTSATRSGGSSRPGSSRRRRAA